MPGRIQGSLPDPAVHEILRSLAASSGTGVLHLVRGGARKRIHLERGRICFAATTRPDERLGALAVRERLASWWQVQEAARDIGVERRLGVVMVDLGILSPEERNRLVREQLREIVIEALGWEEGSFRFAEGELPEREAITLDWPVADAVLARCRRENDERRLWAGVGGLGGLVVPMSGDGLAPPGDLDSAERRVLAALGGGRTVSQVIQAAAVPHLVAVRTLTALHRLGRVRVVRGRSLVMPRPASGRGRPAHAVPAGAPERPAGRYAMAGGEEKPSALRPLPPEVREERAAILDLVEALPGMDYYQVLGLHPGASPEAIARAFGEMAVRFHVDRAMGAGLADLRGALERAHHAIQIAHRTLSDPAERAEYDARRQQEWVRRQRALAAVEQSSEAYLDRGSRLIREGRLPDAIPPLQEAVRLRPDLAVAHYRLGQCLATVPGQRGAAREHLRRACELEPDNRRYADTLRSLRPVRPDRRPRLTTALRRWLRLPPPGEEG